MKTMQRLSTSCQRLPRPRVQAVSKQALHTTAVKPATPLPHPTIPGPPPASPVPAVTSTEDRVSRRRKQAELLERGKALRTNPAKPGTALQKRFWKDVHVKEVPGKAW